MKKTILILIALLVAPQGQAAELKSQIEAYLTALSEARATFRQFEAAKPVSAGTFYLKRPGKFAWTYDSGDRIIANGRAVFYVDPTTEQATQLPANSGLASLFLKDAVSLDGRGISHTIITDDNANEAHIKLTFDEMPGHILLGFTRAPLTLTHLVTVDATGHEIYVSFDTLETSVALSDALFTVDLPNQDIWP